MFYYTINIHRYSDYPTCYQGVVVDVENQNKNNKKLTPQPGKGRRDREAERMFDSHQSITKK